MNIVSFSVLSKFFDPSWVFTTINPYWLFGFFLVTSVIPFPVIAMMGKKVNSRSRHNATQNGDEETARETSEGFPVATIWVLMAISYLSIAGMAWIIILKLKHSF